MSRLTRWVLMLAVLAIWWFPTSPARADTAPTVDVVIDRLTPLVPREGGSLRIGGRLVNGSTDVLNDVKVRLHLSSVRLAGASQIDDVLAAPVDGPWNEAQDYILDWSTVDVADQLEAGSQESFSFEIPFSELPLGQPGTYVVGIEAQSTQDGVERRAGLTRTFLPWFPSAAEEIPVVRLAWIWPLSDQPARTADGTLLDDRTPTAISPGGRLHELVTIGSEYPGTLTWVMDPALLQTAAQISDGYRVIHDGQVMAGDRAPQAGAWLDLLRRAIASSTSRAIAYAAIDADAVRRADMPNDVVRSVTGAEEIASSALGEPVQGGLFWAPGGIIDRPTANLLASSGTSVVIRSTSSDSGTPLSAQAVASIGTPSGNLDFIVGDPRLAQTLAMPQRTSSEILLARQRFLAETALLAQDADGSVTIVACPPDLRWSPSRRFISPLLRATSEAPWLEPTSLESLLGGPRVSASLPTYGAQQRKSELPEDYLLKVRRAQDRLGRLASVLADPGAVVPPFSLALLRAESSAWRTDLSTGEALLRSIGMGLTTQANLVRVLSSGTVTFSGDAGRVPVTIANDGDQQVTVGLTLIGTPTTRLEAETVRDIVIEPGRKVSLDVNARVIGGEPLDVRVQLLTPSGERFGSAGSISVISTAYARVASWVVLAAFAALAVFVLVGVVQRIRRARRPAGGLSA